MGSREHPDIVLSCDGAAEANPHFFDVWRAVLPGPGPSADAASALDARPSPHAELGRAPRAAFSTRQLVRLDGRAEQTRFACAPAAGWVQLMGCSPVEMWSDSSGAACMEPCMCVSVERKSMIEY